MEKIIHINNTDLYAINKIDQIGNYEKPELTNFQYSLFSTMFMSGAEYIELDKSLVHKEILNNPFWKNKFIDGLTPKYLEIINRAAGDLIPHFARDEDNMSIHPYNMILSSYLGNLYYTARTGIPCVMSHFKTEENQSSIQSAVTPQFYQNFINFHKLMRIEDLDTLAPKYSALKKEVRIFEDITASALYRDYQDLHNELKFSDKISLLAKDIKVSTMKIYYKYLGNFDLKKSAFNYIRETKLIGNTNLDSNYYLMRKKLTSIDLTTLTLILFCIVKFKL